MVSLITTANGSRQVMFLVVMGIFLLISYIAVSLRLFCRHVYLRTIGLDDYFAIAALLSITALAIMNILHVSLGTGRHTDELPLLEILIPTLKHWYAYQLVYPFALFLVKASILAMYRRIFVEKKFRVLLWATAGLIMLQTIVVIFVNAFECHTHPDRAWSPTFPKGCNNLPAAYYSMSSINIITDIIILVLPFPVLLKLQLHRGKRLALIGIFMTGSVAILASIMRFYALYTYATTKDVAYDAIYILLWSQIEVNIALISASAPALRPLFKKTFGSTHDPSQGYGTYPSSGPNAYARSQRPNTHGAIELHSYTGKNETVVKTVKDSRDSNSSQEQILERPAMGIIKTIETDVSSRHADEVRESVPSRR